MTAMSRRTALAARSAVAVARLVRGGTSHSFSFVVLVLSSLAPTTTSS